MFAWAVPKLKILRGNSRKISNKISNITLMWRPRWSIFNQVQRDLQLNLKTLAPISIFYKFITRSRMRTLLFIAVVLVIELSFAQAAPQFAILGGLGVNKTLVIYRFDYGTGTLTFDSALENYQAPNWLSWHPDVLPNTIIVGNRKKGTTSTSKLTAVSWNTVTGADGNVAGTLTNIPNSLVETIDPAHLLVS